MPCEVTTAHPVLEKIIKIYNELSVVTRTLLTVWDSPFLEPEMKQIISFINIGIFLLAEKIARFLNLPEAFVSLKRYEYWQCLLFLADSPEFDLEKEVLSKSN